MNQLDKWIFDHAPIEPREKNKDYMENVVVILGVALVAFMVWGLLA